MARRFLARRLRRWRWGTQQPRAGAGAADGHPRHRVTAYSGVPFTFLGHGRHAALFGDFERPGDPAGRLPRCRETRWSSLPGNVAGATTVSFTCQGFVRPYNHGPLTVNPALLLPASITITGNPNCAASGATLCSGQDGSALVQVIGPAGRRSPDATCASTSSRAISRSRRPGQARGAVADGHDRPERQRGGPARWFR